VSQSVCSQLKSIDDAQYNSLAFKAKGKEGT
jgi:hypothetical protein